MLTLPLPLGLVLQLEIKLLLPLKKKKEEEENSEKYYTLQRRIELSITMLYLVLFSQMLIQVDPYVKWGLFL